MDVAQEYFDQGFMKLLVDVLAQVKVNKILLHMIDDDSFAFEMPSLSDSASKTAFTPDEIYTLAQVENFVAYAKERGITVNPEFSIPSRLRPFNELGLDYLMTCHYKW